MRDWRKRNDIKTHKITTTKEFFFIIIKAVFHDGTNSNLLLGREVAVLAQVGYEINGHDF